MAKGVGLSSSPDSSLEIHRHEFEVRPVSPTVLLPPVELSKYRYKLGGELALIRVRVFPGTYNKGGRCKKVEFMCKEVTIV